MCRICINTQDTLIQPHTSSTSTHLLYNHTPPVQSHTSCTITPPVQSHTSCTTTHILYNHTPRVQPHTSCTSTHLLYTQHTRSTVSSYLHSPLKVNERTQALPGNTMRHTHQPTAEGTSLLGCGVQSTDEQSPTSRRKLSV
jgi:hypothetical protein